MICLSCSIEATPTAPDSFPSSNIPTSSPFFPGEASSETTCISTAATRSASIVSLRAGTCAGLLSFLTSICCSSFSVTIDCRPERTASMSHWLLACNFKSDDNCMSALSDSDDLLAVLVLSASLRILIRLMLSELFSCLAADLCGWTSFSCLPAVADSYASRRNAKLYLRASTIRNVCDISRMPALLLSSLCALSGHRLQKTRRLLANLCVLSASSKCGELRIVSAAANSSILTLNMRALRRSTAARLTKAGPCINSSKGMTLNS